MSEVARNRMVDTFYLLYSIDIAFVVAKKGVVERFLRGCEKFANFMLVLSYSWLFLCKIIEISVVFECF